MKRVLFFCLAILFSISPIRAKTLNDSIPPGQNFQKAAFRLWIPDGLTQIKAILVLVPGSNGDGRGMATDSVWQDLATRQGLALLGCYFTDFNHPEPAIELYIKAPDGSGQALVDVIGRFAPPSGHPELTNAPLLMWGHSAGGQFNYEFACWKPERVMGFVVNKGGVYYTAITTPAARKVPGLFFAGEKDIEFRTDIVKGIFSGNRRFGALWAFALEPGAGHEIGSTQKMAISFFEGILSVRMPPMDADEQGGLREIPEASGWIGDPKTHEIMVFPNWKKGNYPTSWLPTKKIAENWLAFIEGRSF